MSWKTGLKKIYISQNINESPRHSHVNLELLKTNAFVGSGIPEPGYIKGQSTLDTAMAFLIKEH